MGNDVILVGGTTISVPIGSTDYMQWINCFRQYMVASNSQVHKLEEEVSDLKERVIMLEELLSGMITNDSDPNGTDDIFLQNK